jgi:hypothetical protein
MLRDDRPEWRRHARALRASQHAPRKLPETQKAGGGAGQKTAALAKDAPPRGGPAPVFGNSRVPFMDDYEREEDLLDARLQGRSGAVHGPRLSRRSAVGTGVGVGVGVGTAIRCECNSCALLCPLM